MGKVAVAATTNMTETISKEPIDIRSTPTCAECLGIVAAIHHEAAGLFATQELVGMSMLRDLKQE